MVKVGEVPVEVDLLPFSRWLSSQRVIHRISEESGFQVVWLDVDKNSDQTKSSVESALTQYLQNADFKEQVDAFSAQLKFSFKPGHSVLPRPTIAQAPISMILIFLAAAVALITNFGDGGPALRALLIVDSLGVDISSFSAKFDLLLATLGQYQLWRLFSPDFVHFSVMHLVFNLLMLWFLGGQVEHRQGRKRLFLLFVACSVVPNVAQYFESGPLFGGMSGVVYGLVGYCWLWSRRHPGVLIFPPALMGVSVAWLIIGYTPLTEMLLIGKMANSAHLFGLLMGLLVAVIPLRASPDSNLV